MDIESTSKMLARMQMQRKSVSVAETEQTELFSAPQLRPKANQSNMEQRVKNSIGLSSTKNYSPVD